jgi:O-antigen/teichoic acid export membrane protein
LFISLRENGLGVLKKLRNQSEFTKHVWTLLTGTASSQLIMIAFSPVLTRLYTPEEFGIFAIFLSSVGLISAAAAGRYEYAILKPKKYFESLSLLLLSVLLITIVSLISLVVILFFFDEINHLMHMENYQYILFLVPITIFLTSLFLVLTLWNNRNKNFVLSARGNIAKSLFSSMLQVMLSILPSGLILGQIVGNALSLLILCKNFFTKDIKMIKYIQISNIVHVLKKYKNFPRYTLPHIIITSLKGNGTILLISMYFGNTTLGFYSLAMRALVMPVSIVGGSVSQVFYQKAAHMHIHHLSIYDFTIKTIRNMFILAVPIFALIYVISPILFSFVFGEKWTTAGIYVQALVPYMFSLFILSTVTDVTLIFDRQKIYFYWGMAEAIGVISIFFIGNLFKIEIINILYMLSLFISLYAIGMLYWLISVIKYEEISFSTQKTLDN